jgi:hypothetical protein
VIGWLQRATPYAAISDGDPLFQYEIRRVRWGQTRQQLVEYSLKVLVIIQALALILWGLFILATPNRLTTSSYVIFSATIAFLGWLFVAGAAAGLFLDCLSITAAVNSIRRDINGGQSDLICLSGMYAEQFVTARYAVVQARAWRIMAVVSSIRLAIFPVIVMGVILAPRLLLVVFDLFIFASGYWLIYCIEPLWRMQAVTALGLAISARVHSPSAALLVAMVAIAVLWGVQSLVIAIVASLLAADNLFGSFFLCIVCGPLIAIPLGLVIRALYSRLQSWAIGDAARYAFLPD